MHEHLIVDQGSVIKGTFALGPNATNERDLDIQIAYQFDGRLKSVDKSHSYRMC